MKIKYERLRVYKYIVTETYVLKTDEFKGKNVNTKYFSITGDAICIKKDSKSDGPSGLTIDTDDFMRGAFIHDMLYSAIRQGYLKLSDRKLADKILYRLCREDGMGLIRANYVYYALRVGGRKAALRGLAEQR